MAKKSDLSIPYPPSWQNLFFETISQLPVPKPVVFIMLFLGFVLLNHLVPWLEGKLPWGEMDAKQFNFHIWFLVVFIGFDYFLSYSKTAMIKFRPSMEIGEQEYELLRYRFTYLTVRSGWLVTFLGTLIFIGGFSSATLLPSYQTSGWSLIVYVLSGAFQFSLVFGFILYLFRAFQMIQSLYALITNVNIFHLEQIYVFSGYTSRIGIFFILVSSLSYITDIAFAEQPNLGSFIFFSSMNLLLAVAAFILPLSGMRKRLEEAKERENYENDKRLAGAKSELHRRMDEKNMAGMGDFHSGLSALLELRQEIKKISTLPWDFATLRNFIAALFVPLAVWSIQQMVLLVMAN